MFEDIIDLFEDTRNLTDEELEIYNSWLNAEAEYTGISLFD